MVQSKGHLWAFCNPRAARVLGELDILCLLPWEWICDSLQAGQLFVGWQRKQRLEGREWEFSGKVNDDRNGKLTSCEVRFFIPPSSLDPDKKWYVLEGGRPCRGSETSWVASTLFWGIKGRLKMLSMVWRGQELNCEDIVFLSTSQRKKTGI